MVNPKTHLLPIVEFTGNRPWGHTQDSPTLPGSESKIIPRCCVFLKSSFIEMNLDICPPIRAQTIQDRSYWIGCCSLEWPTTQSMVPESTSMMTLWFSACSIIQQATPHIAYTATTYICLLRTTWTINQRLSIGTLRTTELMLSCQCWKVQCINEVFQDVSLHVHTCAFYRCWRLKHLGCADLIEDRCVRMTPYSL